MSLEFRRDVVRLLVLSVWGLFTMVLVFCVFLLVNEMHKSGQDPLGALRPDPQVDEGAGAAARRPLQPMGAREVTLYFASPDGRFLVPETRTLELEGSTLENCRAALKALIAGPRESLAPILPPDAAIRAIYPLPKGELAVDFSRELKTRHARFKSTSMEALLVYGVVNTLTQEAIQAQDQPPVRCVRFLFDGAPQDTFPAHVDLTDPIEADATWLRPADDAGLHG